MPTEIKRNSTTLIFDLRDFVPLDEAAHYLLCLNENTYYLVLSLFQFYGYWTNRYTPNSDGDVWYKAEDDDATFVRDMYDKGMEELQMPVCFDTIAEKLDGLIAAVSGLTLACNPQITVEPAAPTVTCAPDVTVTCGSGGISNGGGYGGGFGIDPDPDPGQPSPGDPPVSWTDPPEDYAGYKCKAANVLVLNLAEFLAQCSTFKDSDYTLWESKQPIIDWVASKLILASSIIGSMLNSSAAWIADKITLFVYPVGHLNSNNEEMKPNLTVFSDLRLNVLNDRETIVCGLYNAQTVSEAKSVIVDTIQDYLLSLTYAGDEEQAAIDIVGAYLTNVWLNRLFVKDSQVANYTDQSAVDCVQCSGEIVIYRGRGQNLTRDGNTYTIYSVPGEPWGMMRIAFGLSPEGAHGCFHITDFSLTGYVAHPNPAISIWYQGGSGYTVLGSGATATDIAIALIGRDVVDVDLATDSFNPQYHCTFTVSPC